jgi:hypothetical protein
MAAPRAGARPATEESMRRSTISLAFLVTTACGGSDQASLPDHCNPLGHEGAGCLLPWPSSAFQRDDGATATGLRLDLPLAAMPVNIDAIAVDPAPWNRIDGFSPSGAIVAAFPGGVSADGLPPHHDPAASLAADAAVVVVDVETGERAVVFAEIDMNVKPELRTLIIRPLERLRAGARYAVGIRDTVKGAGGEPLPRSPGFQALVDGAGFDHPRFDAVAANADTMFAALAAAGLPPDQLVLAWDFVTASDASLTSDLLTMRDAALPAMGPAGESLGFELTEVSADPGRVYRALLGTFEVPNFLSDGERVTTRILRDEAGAPVLDDALGTANLAAIIPACVTTAELPLETVIFGHGLFGTGAGYVEDRFLQEIANEHCVVIFASDWIGLSERQLSLAAFAANDFNKSNALSEMLGQGVINFIALEHLVRGGLAGAPELTYEGQPVIDPTRLYYLGGSLGGIMGGTFMAYDPTILRGVLGVPGGAWSLLIERSTAWTPLQIAAQAAYKDPYVYQILIALLASSFERWDPITTARRVLADPLPGTPAKQLLLYEALNDALVTNLATEMVARTMGLAVTGPSVRSPYGLPVADGPQGSALTIYDEQPEPAVPTTNVPPIEDNGTHSGVNERPAVMRAALHFLRQAEVVHECKLDGAPMPCDCTTGACE